MNAAMRMSSLLLKINSSQGKNASEVFEDVFGVKGCVPVASKLAICDKQIAILEEKSDKRLTQYLRTVFNCNGLSRNFVNEKKQINQYIVTLNTAGAYMDDEIINESDITELSEMLETLRAKTEQADIPEHYREVIDSFINEMRDAVVDIDIGGIDAFMSHSETAGGKIVMYHEAFVKGGVMDDVSNIFGKATKIINDSKTWIGLVGYMSGKMIG